MTPELFDGLPAQPDRRLNPEDTADIAFFRNTIWEYFRIAGRPMPWRDDPNPYWVLVSEVMLQQTQVPRVLIRFPRFVERFPTIAALATAPFSEVLAEWSGLGYNRRARFLHAAAGQIVDEHDGQIPEDPAALVRLPGIGVNTAGSIAAFAYNRPVVFIETNIRRVFLHFFFAGVEDVHDRDILPLVEHTLPRDRPREWYWALMDYGVALPRHAGNANRRSRHYSRQKPFADSDRQIRGRILRLLTETGAVSVADLPDATGFPAPRVAGVADTLAAEGFIRRTSDDRWVVAD